MSQFNLIFENDEISVSLLSIHWLVFNLNILECLKARVGLENLLQIVLLFLFLEVVNYIRAVFALTSQYCIVVDDGLPDCLGVTHHDLLKYMHGGMAVLLLFEDTLADQILVGLINLADEEL